MSQHSRQPQAPLHAVKANLFKALADPVRVRILETLTVDASRTFAIDHLAAAAGLEPDDLGPHLSILRRHGAIHAHPGEDGSPVYSVAHPLITEIVLTARQFLLQTTQRTSHPHLTPMQNQDSATKPASIRLAQPARQQSAQSEAMEDFAREHSSRTTTDDTTSDPPDDGAAGREIIADS